MNINELKLLINNIIAENYINEVFKEIETKYRKGVDDRGDETGNVYYFETSKKNNYYVLFTPTFENPNEIICNNKKLIDYIHNPYPQNSDNYIIKSIHITFGYTGIPVDNLNNDEIISGSTNNTNMNEQYEVFGRLLYLIKIYKNENTDVDIYVAASDDTSKINVYKNIYNNLFSSEYKLFECNSNEYSSNSKVAALYMIDNYFLK